MKVTILGCGGWIPSYERMTCCYMVEHKSKLIFLDAGTGIANLIQYKSILENYKELHIILSHYHLDHTIGLSYLSNFVEEHTLFLYLPKNSFFEDGGKEILNKLFSKEFFSREITNISRKVNFIEYDSDFFIDNISIHIREQKHTSPSYGIMIDDLIAYCTDTIAEAESFVWAKKVKLLLHECWDFSESKKLHASFEDIKLLSEKYDIKHTVLIHLNPNIMDDDYKKKCIGNRISIAKDFQVFNL